MRTWRTTLVILSALLALPVMTYAWLDWESARAVRKEFGRLRAAGEPLTLAAITPPPVPDAENAALLYLRAFPHLREIDRLKNGYWDARRATATDRQWSLDRLRPLVEANRYALELATRGSQLTASRLPINWEKYDPVNGGTGALAHDCRDLAITFAAQAWLQNADGEAVAAMNSCLAGLRVSRQLMQEPDIIAWMSSEVMQAILLTEMSRVLEEHQVPPDICAAAFKQVTGADPGKSLRHTLQAHRVQGLVNLEYFSARPRELWQQYDQYDAMPRWALALRISPLGGLLGRNERLWWLQTMGRLLELSERPYREVAGETQRVDAEEEQLPSYYAAARLLTVPTILIRSRDRLQTRYNATAILLALETYRGRCGKYPDSVAALCDYPGWKLPEDPFSGKGFAYRRRGKGFVLYSYGDDLDDDGGRPAAHRGSDGDLVWEFQK